MRKSLLAIAASAVGALSLSVSAAETHRPSNDGRYRGVNIVNQLPPDRGDGTKPFGIVTFIFATPRSGPTTIPGDRLGDEFIPPGESRMVIFDDGYGACLYDVRFVLRFSFDPPPALIDVCRTGWFVLR